MEIKRAHASDVDTYVRFARDAQQWIRARGLEQYVPAGHEEYADAVQAHVESGRLYAVEAGGSPVAFFTLDPSPSCWWANDGTPALYLAGIVVAREARGRAIGSEIIRWCLSEAARRCCRFLRLDCHAGNTWLCRYYERHGFVHQRQIEQHPGYLGNLYQQVVPSQVEVPRLAGPQPQM